MNDAEMICDSFRINQDNGTVEFITKYGFSEGCARIPLRLFSDFVDRLEEFVASGEKKFVQDNKCQVASSRGRGWESIWAFDSESAHVFRVATTAGRGSKCVRFNKAGIRESIFQLRCELQDLIDEGFIEDPRIPNVTASFVDPLSFDNGEG